MTKRAGKTANTPLTPTTARQLLAEVAARYNAARDELAAATDAARGIARRARGEAELSKVEIAGILDVQRPTLDRWLGE